jgi:hypothetical protein
MDLISRIQFLDLGTGSLFVLEFRMMGVEEDMGRKFLGFDIETAKHWRGDFSAWRRHRPLGISCAATVAGDSGETRLWHGKNPDGTPAAKMAETDLTDLVQYLVTMSREDYSIVTWNGLQFDFDVLAEESTMWEPCRELAGGHVDMMFQVLCQLGHVLSLDAAAKGMKLSGKIDGMSGMLAPEMWGRGEHEQVLKYVEQDARCTRELAEAAESSGRLRWISQRGGTRDMPLPNGWLTVEQAMQLPKPDTSWMKNPIKRESLTKWLRA